MNFLEIICILLLQKNFDMAKNIRSFLENLFEYYFLNIFVNFNFFIDFRFKYYCEYYLELLINEKLKLMGGAMKFFTKKLMGHEIFRSMVS